MNDFCKKHFTRILVVIMYVLWSRCLFLDDQTHSSIMQCGCLIMLGINHISNKIEEAVR